MPGTLTRQATVPRPRQFVVIFPEQYQNPKYNGWSSGNNRNPKHGGLDPDLNLQWLQILNPKFIFGNIPNALGRVWGEL